METEGSIHDALVAAEFVVTDFSTAGAEAVLLGRPLLTVNTTGTPFAANDYAAFGVAVQACTLDEAGPLLRRLLDEGCFWPQAEAARARFIEAYNWQGDGRACRRFLEFIEQSTADDGDNLL